METKHTFKGWYQLKYPFDARLKVEMTLQSFLGRKHQGVYKVYCPHDRSLREKVFYFVIEGIEFYNMLIDLFPSLTPCEPPVRKEVTRIIGSQQERDWMFKVQDAKPVENIKPEKTVSRKARYLNQALKSGE